jgi:hypothetical protein
MPIALIDPIDPIGITGILSTDCPVPRRPPLPLRSWSRVKQYASAWHQRTRLQSCLGAWHSATELRLYRGVREEVAIRHRCD